MMMMFVFGPVFSNPQFPVLHFQRTPLRGFAA